MSLLGLEPKWELGAMLQGGKSNCWHPAPTLLLHHTSAEGWRGSQEHRVAGMSPQLGHGTPNGLGPPASLGRPWRNWEGPETVLSTQYR